MVLAYQIILEMKRIIKISLLLIAPLTFLGQEKQTVTYWIPEQYIDSIVLNGREYGYKKYLIPIEAIANVNDKWYIETYKGMLQPLLTSGKPSIKTIAIKELSLNLNVFTRQEQDSINKIKYSFKIYADSLILEGYSEDVFLERKKYIKAFNAYNFEELRKTSRMLLLQGKYSIYNSTGEKMESEIKVSLNGKIIGSTLIDSYIFNREHIPDEHNNFYDLVEFYLKDKTVKKLAIIYHEKEKTWVGYEYQVKNDKYTIHVLPKFVFRFQKMQN
jgi:hypothetical protein